MDTKPNQKPKPRQAQITNVRAFPPKTAAAGEQTAPASSATTGEQSAPSAATDQPAALPRLPRLPRKPKEGKPCACGCPGKTRGGRFLPGHDSKLLAWALRVERKLIKLSEVPEMHREAVRKQMTVARREAKSQNETEE